MEVADRLSATLVEVGVERTAPGWSVARWLQSPSDYEEQLQALLRQNLLAEGKERLASGDHLGALRMFNRLLAIDEENEEVLTLLRGLHSLPGHNAKRTRLIPIGVAALVGVSMAAYALWPATPVETGVPQPDALGEAVEVPPEVPVTNPEVQSDSQPAVVATQRQKAAPVPPPATIAPKRVLKPMATIKPTAASQPAAEPATVMVTVPGSWGDIYIDGELKGRTGSVRDINVGAGTHVLVIRNDHALPHETSFTVAPGEKKLIEVTDLQRKPARVRLMNAPATDCIVSVDGIQRGTVASLAQTVRVREPDRAHALTVACPGGTSLERTLAPAAPGALVTLDLSTP